ncbi:hypothetical protein ACFSLT_28750 [Novosphingobium resinovorum]
MEVTVEDSFVDILASGADAGIRYEERLEQDMIAVPIGPRSQRIITVAALPISISMAALRIPATSSTTPACACASPAVHGPPGSSSAATK